MGNSPHHETDAAKHDNYDSPYEDELGCPITGLSCSRQLLPKPAVVGPPSEEGQ